MSDKKIKAEVMDVTPEMATKWRKTVKNNRSFSATRAAKYARQMKDGHWQMNGQPIILNGGEVLIDGQHRCAAIEESGLTVPMLVVRGVAQNAFLTMDTGTGRNAADLLSIEGATHVAALAAALRWLWKWERGHYKPERVVRAGASQPVPYEILEMHRKHPGMQEVVAYVINRRRGFNYISAGGFGFAFYLMASLDDHAARTFFGKLVIGADLSEDCPIFQLRRRLIRAKEDIKYRQNTTEQTATVINAWNLWRAKQPATNAYAIRWRQRYDAFPEPK